MNIEYIVKNHLAGSSRRYLEDIVNHGIHNISNNFNGSSDDEYAAFHEEFHRQAFDMLESMDGGIIDGAKSLAGGGDE